MGTPAGKRRERFIPLPILAAMAFIVLAVGDERPMPSDAANVVESSLGPLPTVSEAWAQMQSPPSSREWRYWIVAKDTIASISPSPAPGVGSYTIHFMSIQGVPFELSGSGSPYVYGLHPGSIVYAGFFSYRESDWRLHSIISVRAVP